MASERYHHGNLRAALLHEADLQLRSGGIDGLSLRRIAESTGVSRSAPYHHFRDKQALLCALATEGFRELGKLLDAAPLDAPASLEADLGRLVAAYLRFATSHPARYELMFGRTVWHSGQPTAGLRETAYRTFRGYTRKIGALVPDTAPSGRALRLAQAHWATLHGLCRLMIDGIYLDPDDMEEVSAEAVRVMVAAVPGPRADDSGIQSGPA